MAKKRSENKRNPFIADLYNLDLRTKVRVARKGHMIDTVDRNTGEVRSGFYEALITERKYDRTMFVKMYPDGIEAMVGLSKTASLVLKYLLGNLGYGDTVALNMSKALEFTGYKSSKSVYKGISELKERKIIDNHYRNGIYYINPLCFYRGNRLKLIEEL